MNDADAYLDDLMVRTAHHSTAIEGNSLSLYAIWMRSPGTRQISKGKLRLFVVSISHLIESILSQMETDALVAH